MIWDYMPKYMPKAYPGCTKGTSFFLSFCTTSPYSRQFWRPWSGFLEIQAMRKGRAWNQPVMGTEARLNMWDVSTNKLHWLVVSYTVNIWLIYGYLYG